MSAAGSPATIRGHRTSTALKAVCGEHRDSNALPSNWRLCRLACRSFPRKQTPLSRRIFAITDDDYRARSWQVEGPTDGFRGKRK
eukprot:373693-Prymnesium_polylepis.2